MPTSATHVTIVQMLAASDPKLKALLGDPLADASTPEGRQMRFANLGAVGPDIFYAMADYGGDLQDLENFLAQLGGTFECIADLMGQIDRYIGGLVSDITFGVVDSLEQTANLVVGIVKEGILALLVDAGFNLWPVFEASRQKDRPREQWYWAEYLHYFITGKFAMQLLEDSKGDPNLHAYALGYLTHFITDVVGHPYVNQVVQAPWRLYWQYHHNAENFIDAYVWDHWHVPRPAPPPPSTAEQPLDAITLTPNPIGSGAPLTYARLNDHIDIGSPGLADPVDALVQSICSQIQKGLFTVGLALDTSIPAPSEADFNAWTALMANALQKVYHDPERYPKNLTTGILGTGRADGHPTPDDIAAAYSFMRLWLKVTTEERIQEPKMPDIVGDITAELDKLLHDIASALGSIPPIPIPSTDGSLSWDSLLNALSNLGAWLSEAAQAITAAIFNAVRDAIALGLTIAADLIKLLLYLLNKFLFSIYRWLRDILMLNAYTVPFTDQLAVNMGGQFNTSSLWRSSGNATPYPVEEIDAERAFIFSTYAPFIKPSQQPGFTIEQPLVGPIAPYEPVDEVPALTIPDQFIDFPLGPDDMFQATGPLPAASTADPYAPHSFAIATRNFGGAVANCAKAIELAEAGSLVLPDYNLDGDRAYAWPCWDVANEPPYPTGSTPDPLNPDSSPTPGTAHVNAVAVSG